jgi:hypothetical protein
MFFGGSFVWLAQNDTFVSSLEPLTGGKTIFTVIGIALLLATTTISLTQLLDDGSLNTTVLIKYLQEDSL